VPNDAVWFDGAMQVTARLRRKGELKLRALVTEITNVHKACQEVDGQIVPGGHVEFEHIDHVVNALDHALVSIRTLDHEVFEASNKREYLALRDHDGAVVRGLTAPRNAAVHSGDVIDPDLARAVGPIERRFIIFPRWKQRAAISGGAFAKTASGALAAYDVSVAGRTLLDTLFDALAFFDRCDPSLVDRAADGAIVGLPLAPLPIAGYCRLHPDWPSHEEVDARIRRDVTAAPPSGSERRVDGFVRTASIATNLCGYTQITDVYAQAFTEPVAQVVADIAMGYVYKVDVDGSSIALRVEQGALLVDGERFDIGRLPDLTSTEPWMGWAQLAAGDASYYRSQRRPT